VKIINKFEETKKSVKGQADLYQAEMDKLKQKQKSDL
jgi:hypothetical protein